MTSGLFNCYESAADVRSTDEDTWLSRQKLSCSFCYFRTLSFPACMACYGIPRAGRNAWMYSCLEKGLGPSLLVERLLELSCAVKNKLLYTNEPHQFLWEV